MSDRRETSTTRTKLGDYKSPDGSVGSWWRRQARKQGK